MMRGLMRFNRMLASAKNQFENILGATGATKIQQSDDTRDRHAGARSAHGEPPEQGGSIGPEIEFDPENSAIDATNERSEQLRRSYTQPLDSRHR
jgi:hypothetical protein